MSLVDQFHAAHKARLVRLGASSSPYQAPYSPPLAQEPEPTPEEIDAWAARQLEINPLPKTPWFSIVQENGPPKVGDIIRAVCRHFDITRNDILSQRRDRRVVRPRQIGYFLCKKLTQTSLPEIGRRFAGRDHTSILHGIRVIERLVERDDRAAADIEAIKAKLR